MSGLAFTRVTDDQTADLWTQVHNQIIPSDPLTVAQVVERSKLYALDLATLDGTTVGCSTVRPVVDDELVTVIVRILPTYRRRGLGSALLAHAFTHARAWDADHIQTIVHGSNVDGLEFALQRGFVETDRYTLDGESVPYIHLATALDDPGTT